MDGRAGRAWHSGRRWQGAGAIVTWILALAWAAHAHAQAISLASFTQQEGLTSLEDNCLLQDRQGFVFVCTENGLFRFDGRMFQRLDARNGLAGSYISALHEDALGRLWVGTRSGLFAGDGARFELAGPAGAPLSVDPGATLADLDGRLYAVSQHQLWQVQAATGGWQVRPRFDAAALRASPEVGDVTSVFSDGHALWFGCGKALCRLSGGGLSRWGEREGIPPDTWTSYLLARDGTLWVRSPRYIRTLAPGAAKFAEHDLDGARVVTAFLDMVQDERGRVLTRANDGLARWDGLRWRVFGTGNGLPDIGIDALLYDRDHVLWIGTYGRGVLQWRGYDQIESWQTTQGLDSNPSWAIARATDGALWIGDELGGSTLAPGAPRLAPWPLKPPPLAQETIDLHALPDGDMLAAYYSGELLRYHASRGTTELLARSPAYVRRMLVDSHGQVWLCTERGLYVFDGRAIKRAGEPVIPDDALSEAHEDAQGRLWVSGAAGLFRLQQGRWSRMRVAGTPLDRSFTHMDVLADGEIYLAGNFSGLWRGRATNGDSLPMEHVPDDLLDGTRAYFIRHDRRGWLWIGGTDGVEIFDGRQWRRLTEDDGLIWDDIAENAFFEDADGSVWIGTTNGVSHILRPDALAAAHPLQVLITGFSVGGQAKRLAGAYRFDEAPGQPVTLHLAVLGAPTRRTMQYRYRLLGLERDWVSSDRPQIDYPPLPPGDFVFEAAAYDPDRRMLSPVVRLPVHVVPPWWQRLPAILGGLLLLALGIAVAWRLRTRQLRMRARALESMIALRTRELEIDKQSLEEARAALWQQATHDALTGLPNRSRVLDILGQAIAQARIGGQPLAVALIDLDHFKRINDRYGHLAGDAVLIEVATRLRGSLLPGATLGRYGGEELLAVVPGVPFLDIAPFEALRRDIAQQPFHGDGMLVNVTGSIGIAWLQPQDRDAFDLIRRADGALYVAKTSGRNRVVVADERWETG